jgi:hypothetical protein
MAAMSSRPMTGAAEAEERMEEVFVDCTSYSWKFETDERTMKYAGQGPCVFNRWAEL